MTDDKQKEYQYDRRMKESDQLIKGSYIQIPMVLFTSEKYKTLSNNCRALYGLLQSRWKLSVKNNWVDKRGDVYFIYTNKELVKYTGLSERVVIKCKKDLASLGLLEEEKTTLSNRIYLLTPEYDKEDIDGIRNYNLLHSESNNIKFKRRENGSFAPIYPKDENSLADEKSVRVETAVNKESALTDEKSVRDNDLLKVSSELTKSQSIYIDINKDSLDTDIDTKDTKETSENNFTSELDDYLWENLEDDILSRQGNILDKRTIFCLKLFAQKNTDKVYHWIDIIYQAKSKVTKDTNVLLLEENGDIDHRRLENTVRRILTMTYKTPDEVANPDGLLYKSLINVFEEMANEISQGHKEW